MSRPLKVGVVLLTGEGGHAGEQPRWATIKAIAETIETAGFDSISMPDHLMHAPQDILQHFGQPVPDEWSSLPPTGWWENWTLLTAIACATKRVTLGPLVTCAPYRNPALLARMAVTLDEVSNGRLVLGMGAGDAPGEFRAFGIPHDHLVSRFEESVTIVHQLMREGVSDFRGIYNQTAEAELRVQSSRSGGPPLMISAKGPRMIAITARFADAWNGWVVFERSHPDSLRPAMEMLDRACESIGRDPVTLRRTAGVAIDIPGYRSPVGEPISGSHAQIADQLMAFADAGFAEVQVLVRPNSLAALETFTLALNLLDQ